MASSSPLRGLKMSELMKRAALAGVSPDEIADAQDEESPKERLAALIEQRDPRVELGALKMSALMKRAHAAGVTPDAQMPLRTPKTLAAHGTC